MKKLIIYLKENHDLEIKGRVDAVEDILQGEDLCSAVLVDSLLEASAGEEGSSESPQEKTEAFIDISFSELLQTVEKDIEEQNLRTVMVLPPFLSLHAIIDVPAKKFRQIQKALPFLVEDQLASEPEKCFIAVGQHDNDKLHCELIDKTTVAAYRDSVQEKKLNCDTLITMSDLLPSGENALHVFENFILLTTRKGERFSLTSDLLEVYLEKFANSESPVAEAGDEMDGENEALTSQDLSAEDYEKKELLVYLYPDGNTEEDLSALQKGIEEAIHEFSRNNEFNYNANFVNSSRFDFYSDNARALAHRYDRKNLINFFQNEFKVRKISKGVNFNINFNWKPAARLLAALLLMGLFSLYIDTYRFQKASEEADLKTKAVFNQIFPGTKNYTRMKSRVAALTQGGATEGQGQFISLMVLFSESLSGLSGQIVKPTRFQYEQNNGDLKVDVVASDFDSLTSLKELAKSKGLLIDISSTSTDDSGIKGRLEVRIQ